MTKKVSAGRVVWTSFFVDVLDVLFNIAIALLTGSVVMLSEALQGLMDLITAGLLVIGLKKSKRRANALYNFGYGREVYFWTLLAAVVMATFTASVSFYYGLRRFLQPTPVDHLSIAWIVLALGLMTNSYAFFLSYRRLREEYPKQSIWKTFLYTNRIETKATFILDLTGSLAALLGLGSLILYGITGNSQFDGLGAMVIGVVMLGLSFMLVLGVKDFLIGRGADPKITQDIKDAALKVNDVLHIVDVHTMYIGTDKLLVNMEVHIDPKLKADDVEAIIDRIKARVQKDIPSIHHMHVELETPD